jgi:hypothetical protein
MGCRGSRGKRFERKKKANNQRCDGEKHEEDAQELLMMLRSNCGRLVLDPVKLLEEEGKARRSWSTEGALATVCRRARTAATTRSMLDVV